MTQPALAEHVRGRGRMYRNPATDELVPSITNAIGVLSKDALPRWAARSVAETAYRMRNALPEMDEAEAVDMLKSSPWNSSKRAADRGTSIHGYLEARLLGRPTDDLSEEATQYVAAAEAWLDAWKPEPRLTETTVFGIGYAGTGDLWCRIDGQECIVDFKTGKALYPDSSLQIAALWGASEAMVDGELRLAPPVTSGRLVLIGQAGKHETRSVTDLVGAFEAFESAVQLWWWRHGEKPLSKPETPETDHE
jgi:hypothetical protein